MQFPTAMTDANSRRAQDIGAARQDLPTKTMCGTGNPSGSAGAVPRQAFSEPRAGATWPTRVARESVATSRRAVGCHDVLVVHARVFPLCIRAAKRCFVDQIALRDEVRGTRGSWAALGRSSQPMGVLVSPWEL